MSQINISGFNDSAVTGGTFYLFEWESGSPVPISGFAGVNPSFTVDTNQPIKFELSDEQMVAHVNNGGNKTDSMLLQNSKFKVTGQIIQNRARDLRVLASGGSLPAAASHKVGGSITKPKLTLLVSWWQGDGRHNIYLPDVMLESTTPAEVNRGEQGGEVSFIGEWHAPTDTLWEDFTGDPPAA